MLVQDETIQTLMEIGLTGLQAKVYLTLAGMEKASGKTLWKSSGAARQDIYRILDELQNKGLIEKILTTPTEYRAIPIQDGLSILLKRKADQYKEAEAKIENLRRTLKTDHEEKASGEQQFVLIPAKEAHTLRINQAFMNLQKSIDTLMIAKGNCSDTESKPKLDSKCISKILPPLLVKAIMRGVRSRHILNVPQGTKPVPERIIWKKNGSYELRFIQNAEPAILCIVDEKEVFFATEPTLNPHDSDVLWTNNPSIVNVAKTYFETLWQTST